MERKGAQLPSDHWISDLAERQHGVVAWFQLRAVGFTRGYVDFRLAERRLHIIHRGVYAVGHRVLTREGYWMAAVLAHGEQAVLSHRTAAEHWGMLPPSLSKVAHVTVPGRGARKRRQGIALHRVPAVEGTVHDAIPITTVPWTLLDLAASAERRLVEQAVDGAERAGLLDAHAHVPLLDASRNGVSLLRSILAGYDSAPTETELERLFLRLCADYDLPRPDTQVWLEGFRVDFLWPDERLIVETDGGMHAGRVRMEKDRERDTVLGLAGYRVLRFTWRQVTGTPEIVARLVRETLVARRP